MNTKIWASAILLALLASGAARANDGGIAYGGSPKLLSGHPSVSMQSEVITMRIGEAKVTTDCRFVFRNSGKACTVRMGFPDQGDGAFDPDESNDEAGDKAAVMKMPPRTTFDSFVSYVNGKRVKTKLIRANIPGKFWHTKTVTFPAHSMTQIRDVYSQSLSVQVDESNGYHKQVAYILHTGSSWHGAIGRSTVNIIFRRKSMPGPLTAHQTKIVDDMETVKWKKARLGEIYYIGPATPTVSGRTLCFTRINWRPKTKDDIRLFFREDPKDNNKEHYARYSKKGKK